MKKDIFFEYYVQYLKKLHELHNDLPLLPETMKTEKLEKFVASFHDKTEYVIDIRNLKQALSHGLVLKKVHGVIKFNQSAWLKLYIDMNTDLRKIKKLFSKGLWWIMQFLEKLWKMWKNIEILNLSQQKEEGII